MKRSEFVILLGLLTLFSTLIFRVEHRSVPKPSQERCLYCHGLVSDPSASHPVQVFGCSKCHLGNPYSLDKKSAHFGMIKNPGDLSVVRQTCGQPNCHGSEVTRVQNGLMATNRGIIGTLLQRWEGKNIFMDVVTIKGSGKVGSLALDLYVKMCGGCHLWQKVDPRGNWSKNRGGGCSACHIVSRVAELRAAKKKYNHPELSTVIPVQNCLRCHNRSARIGLSYLGVYESAGYGTPFYGNSADRRRLSGGRFYLKLPADVHWEKHNMLCIDCHTTKGIMGDGKKYNHFEEQVEITCEACHEPEFHRMRMKDSIGLKLVKANHHIKATTKTLMAFAKKNSPLYNLQKINGNPVFYLKKNGEELSFKTINLNQAYHNLKGHERLKCQACHSRWIPQCYGCHYLYTKSNKQKDWIWRKKTAGRWKEYRGYIRFEFPTLGVDFDNRIGPFSPCQVFAKRRNRPGETPESLGVDHLIMSAFDPHTTREKARRCIDCHGNAKTLGLGYGILTRNKGKWTFRPTFDSSKSGYTFRHPLDSFVNLEGIPLQEGYRKGSRPFSKKELDKILRVNICLGCHNKYKDKIYGQFEGSFQRFLKKGNLPCKDLGSRD